MLKKNFNLIKLIKNNWASILAVVFLLVVIFVVYKGWIGTDIIARGDWKARSSAWIRDWLNIPFAWDSAEYGGTSNIFGGRIVRYPLYFIQAILNQVFNFRYAITERIIWFFPFLIVSSLAIYLLTKELFKSKIAGYVAIFIFLFNNFTIFRANGAQMVLLMGQAFTPLVLLFYIKAIRRKNFYLNIILAAVFLTILGYNDIRLAILCIGLIFLYSLYIVINKIITKKSYLEIKIRNIVAGFLIMFGVFVLLNTYWLVPTGFSGSKQELVENSFSNIDQVKSLSRSSMFDTLSLSIGSNPAFDKYVYSRDQLINWLIWLLPIIILISVCLKKNKREILFWFSVYIIFAFLAKGMMPPANFINQFFYDHIPLAYMYRLPDKFMYIMATPFAMLYGLACSEIIKRINKQNIYAQIGIILCFISLPIAIIYPAIIGNNRLSNSEGGSSFRSEIPDEYLTIENWFNKQPSDYKTLWILGTPRYDIFSNKHPNFLPINTVQKNSIYNKDYIEYLKNGKNIDKYFSMMNIKYLMLTPKNDPDWTWHAEDQQLDNYLNSIKENKFFNLNQVLPKQNIYIYESKEPLEKINAASNAMFISGSKKSFEYIFNQQNINIKDWNFYLNGNYPNLFESIKDKVNAVLFYNNDRNDLLLDNIYNQYDAKLSFDYNNYHNTLKNFEENILSPDSDFKNIDTDQINSQIDFDYNLGSSGKYEIWTRIAFTDFEDPSLELFIDNQYINTIHPEQKYNKQYKWINLGNTYLDSKSHKIEIKTKSGDASIDKIIFVPEEEFIKKKEILDNWLSDKVILDVYCNANGCDDEKTGNNFINSDNNLQLISWKMINPSQYLVKARINHAGFINLLDSYDPEWSAFYEDKESPSIIVNTISNSFYINPKNKDQEIEITLRYKPQNVVNIGFQIYIFVLCVLCAGIIYNILMKKR